MRDEKYNVIFSDRAASMLVDHVRFLAKVSPEAAERLRRNIIEEASTLEFMPQSYPWLSSDELPSNKYRKKLVSKRYLLIYQIKDNMVYIDYVIDCRQDYRWLL